MLTKRILAALCAALFAGPASAQQIGQPGVLTYTRANSQSQPTAPTAPASTSAYKMQGLGCTITPTLTGAVHFTVSGTIINPTDATVNNGILFQLSYGTGTAPVNTGNLAGTQFGTVQEYTAAVAPTATADVHVPFSTTAIVTGLTVGTTYWFDLAAKSVTTVSSIGLTGVSCTASEI